MQSTEFFYIYLIKNHNKYKEGDSTWEEDVSISLLIYALVSSGVHKRKLTRLGAVVCCIHYLLSPENGKARHACGMNKKAHFSKFRATGRQNLP